MTDIKRFQKIEQRITTATIDENGDVIFLASTENDIFLELGNVVEKRASHVEPVNLFLRIVFHTLRSFAKDKNVIAEWTRRWPCRWRVNTKPVGGPVLTLTHVGWCFDKTHAHAKDIATWRDRRAAIEAEVAFLNKFFLEGRA